MDEVHIIDEFTILFLCCFKCCYLVSSDSLADPGYSGEELSLYLSKMEAHLTLEVAKFK
jgi:hypothetical protein